MFSCIRGVPTHVFHASMTSPEENPEQSRKRQIRRVWERSLKSLCTKHQLEFHGDDISLPKYPVSFNEEATRKKEKRSREICNLKKENPSKVFHKRIRSGDLAARQAAPQSFIDKEMRSQLFLSSSICNKRKRENSTGPTRSTFEENYQPNQNNSLSLTGN